MKMKMVILSLIIALSVLIIPSLGSVNAEVTRMPYDDAQQTAIESIINSDEFNISIVGNSIGMKYKNVNCDYYTDISQITSSNKKYNSIWINGSASSELLKSSSANDIERYLDKGYSVYLYGISDLHLLSTVLLGTNYAEESADEMTEQQVVAFVTKNKNGEYFFGHIFSEESADSENVISAVLASTWNRRNDYNYTRSKHTAAFMSSLSSSVNASSGDDFSIGSSWRCVFGWNQYIWTVPDNWGTYGEWKAGFYLTNSTDGKKYWAMAIEGCMSPNQSMSNVYSKSLYYDSHADCNGQANLLRAYSPKTSPTSNTMNLSVSLGTDSQSISASWPVTQNDLSITDTTSIGDQFMKVTFYYNLGFLGDYTAYARGTSWQNIAIIYQAPDNATSCKFGNGRIASFGNFWMSTRSTTTLWYTTLYTN